MDISLPKRCLNCASLFPMRGSLRPLRSMSTFSRSASFCSPAALPFPPVSGSITRKTPINGGIGNGGWGRLQAQCLHGGG